MTAATHTYRISLTWTGNTGTGTSHYRAYNRDHSMTAPGKPAIAGSSDPAFRGDPSRWNPEDMLLASISSCHQLWYLSLCAQAGVIVTAYEDSATAEMIEDVDHGGHFVSAHLQPTVTLRAGSDLVLAEQLHVTAHHICFIANSVNFPITCT
ncbi:MAG: OsmC family protein, partial [Pseudomonadota bacterium]|nr:OsmC family protein [Pseudomonadota bacterium]